MSGGQLARGTLVAPTLSGRGVLSALEWQQLRQTLRLSKRQLEIVQCMFDDWTAARIAMTLNISQHTVHTHIERLYRKLNVNSRSELLVRVFGEFVTTQAARD